ncbi:hypothetical protein FM106_29270 [Brachybacterium faecium]|nr:hypothetical protein FM106_29270 [Brachybacterium faecium]
MGAYCERWCRPPAAAQVPEGQPRSVRRLRVGPADRPARPR